VSIDASGALRDIGDSQEALTYGQKALAIKKVPSLVRGAALLSTAKAEARLGLNGVVRVDEALTIARNKSKEEDVADLRLNVGFCQMSKARVLLDQGELEEVERLLEEADINTPTCMQRRRCVIQVLQARLLLKQGIFDQAALLATDAAGTAKQIHAQPDIREIQNIYRELLKSTHANSRDVRELGRLL
jgi:tetratricopeptide (TPR) repeat protein